MEKIIVAAISVKNMIGQANGSIDHMKELVIAVREKGHVPAHEQPFWNAGNSSDTFDIGKAKVGITICRDSFFDEMTRALYFKGVEIVLMPFGYYNVPRSQYLKELFLESGEGISEKELLDASRYPWLRGYPLAYILLASYDHHQEHYEKIIAWLEEQRKA